MKKHCKKKTKIHFFWMRLKIARHYIIEICKNSCKKNIFLLFLKKNETLTKYTQNFVTLVRKKMKKTKKNRK